MTCSRLIPAIVAITLLAGCDATPRTESAPLDDRFTAIVACDDFKTGAAAWMSEVRQRFPGGAIVEFAHGGDCLGCWMLYPSHALPIPAEDVAVTLHAISAGRPVVLISCNPGVRDIDCPGVFYARGLVWMRPGGTRLKWLDHPPYLCYGATDINQFIRSGTVANTIKP